ncbi:glycoside hydrolase family 55 protein [Paenibacillus hamazuiensis]|uniref:glycoside hydrolase family 55 protein n=1 Tax=Paenibacillus hamazuiensis TaxID=2936508 RepID=UPI00200D8FE7|nr:glycoside hydrolase family 55 protein [Paenibacillus hamazuiensis]
MSTDLGISVKIFGAVGDGVTDDSSAITNAVNSDEGTIIFPKGVYAVDANLTLPKSKKVVFAAGARLKVNAGRTVAIDSPIDAPLQPIFTGSGTYTTSVKGSVFYPQWFGGTNEGDEEKGVITYRASISAGSNILTIPDADKTKFKDGQTIMIVGAGANLQSTFPTKVPLPTLTLTNKYNVPVPAGTTTYRYRICILDKYGGYTAVSDIAEINNAPDKLGYDTGRVKITFPTGVQRHGWAVYGEQTNPPGSRGILGIFRDVTAFMEDMGQGDISAGIPPWVSSTPPASKVNRILTTTIVSGGGTTSLVLADSAINTVSNMAVLGDNTAIINKMYDMLSAAGGGTILLSRGVYHVKVNPDTARTLLITSNVNLVSKEKGIILCHTNICVDNQTTLSGKGDTASNWTIDGVVLDGGNRVFTCEFAHVFLNTTGNGPYKNFVVKDCEFRYQKGRMISTNQGSCEEYRITGNYFHHSCSNVGGIGGTKYMVDHNLMKDCYNGIDMSGGSKVGTAEALILRSLVNGLNPGTTSYGDIVYNTIENWGSIAFGGALAVYKNINISHNTVIGANLGCSGILENINISNNKIVRAPLPGIPMYFDGQSIKLEMTVPGQSAKNIVIKDNTIKVKTDPLSGHSCSGISVAANNAIAANIKGVSIIGNSIELDAECPYNAMDIHGGGKDYIISDNRMIMPNPAQECSIEVYTNIADANWTVENNYSPGKIMLLPAGSIVKGNRVGGIRVFGNSIISENYISGYITTSAQNTWGGVVNLLGDRVTVSNNVFDLADHGNATQAAIGAVYASKDHVIQGNLFVNMGSSRTTIISVSADYCTIYNNIGAGSSSKRVTELSALPTAAVYWNKGDKIYNTNPTAYIGWVCMTAGYSYELTWGANKLYDSGKVVKSGNYVYRASQTGTGTSGGVAPTHTSGSAMDGTVTWEYVGPAADFKTFGAIV